MADLFRCNIVSAALVTLLLVNVTAADPLPATTVGIAFHGPPPPPTCESQAQDKINATYALKKPLLGDPLMEYPEPVNSQSCYAYRQRFQYGTIFWQQDAAEAFEVNGAIAVKYKNMSEDQSKLGFPITDETDPGSGTTGRFNIFEHGAICWKGNIGTYALWGPIKDIWAHEGLVANPSLGCPISDIIDDNGVTPSGSWASFENGVLYLPAGGAVQNLVGNDPSQGYLANADIVNLLLPTISGWFTNTQWGSLGALFSVADNSMTDYSLDGAGLHNRAYYFYLYMLFWEYSATERSPSDIYTYLGFTIDISLGQGNDAHNVMYSVSQIDDGMLQGYRFSGQQLHLMETINRVLQAPPTRLGVQLGSGVIEVKPMANGDLNVYSRL